MSPADFLACKEVWEQDPHICASIVRDQASFERYLKHNHLCSQVAVQEDGSIIGAIAAGHDGYRGSCHHLMVIEPYRRQGIARRLADAAMQALQELGISYCFVWIYETNTDGAAFWQRAGFERWDDCPTWGKQLGVTPVAT